VGREGLANGDGASAVGRAGVRGHADANIGSPTRLSTTPLACNIFVIKNKCELLNVEASLVPLIEEFLEHYNREFDYYTEVARIVQQQLEATLLSHGIRAMVTSRAKRPDRLREKLMKRSRDKVYQVFNDIYKDVIDLAGVRVALYFPGDRGRVEC